MKQIILCILVVGASLFQGCTAPLVNISGAEQYKDLVGRRFRLRGDCYVYFHSDETKKLPCVCDKRSIPSSITSAWFGKDINGQIFVGALQKDTEFRLESVYRQKVVSSYSSVRYYFIISLEGAGQARWPKLDAIDLTDCNSTDYFKMQPMLPMFLPKYVELVDAAKQ